MTNRDMFLKLLREDILKLDLAELDFGIYRVLNYRRAEIEQFINGRLGTLIGRTLHDHAAEQREALRQQLANARESLDSIAKTLGFPDAFHNGELREQFKAFPAGETFLARSAELRYLEAQTGFRESEEDRLYNALYLFFARYYRDSDFLTQPRRWRDALYSVPYSGEDVHIHWKSRGSHYVKTSEELRSYAYRAGPWRVVFALRTAEEQQDNNKGATRYFIPLPKAAVADPASHTLTVPFAFRPLTKTEEASYNGKKQPAAGNDDDDGERTDRTLGIQDRLLVEKLDELRPKLPGDVPAAELLRNMRRYARKNRTDYFVHGNLKEFLSQEFEFYLKNEFLSTAALTSPEAIREAFLKLETLRQAGGEIIALLDQIESFQARLFEKRKFVLRADYLIPVRLLPEDLLAEVLGNPAQLDAWRRLFGLPGPIDALTLRRRPTLVVDTRLFDAAFTRRALATFEDLDGVTDGLLIHGENYAAPGERDVQVIEIQKLYVDRGATAPKGGVSLPTSMFSGRNLLLVDEGHKGSATKSEKETERAWRDIREALAGAQGFTLEYSATFA